MGVVRLFGQHISYSASPAMHAAGFAALNLDHRYELADISPGQLPMEAFRLRADDVVGANVTTPYKGAFIGLLDEVDAGAATAGAVNTIVRRDDRLHGSNTDIPAIAAEIRRICPTPHHAVILGAGGAARAVALALVDLAPTEVSFVSRAGGPGTHPWSELPDLLPGANLLVNATPVGTRDDESPVPSSSLHGDLAVLDLVYRPSPTRLVREARLTGAPARAGAGVLLEQGWRSLEVWLGQPVDLSVRAAMAGALVADIGDAVDV
jgi:shikimate dehydrogenase